MDPIRNIKLRWLHGTLGDVTYQLTRVQFARSVPARWQPAINAFRCETAVRICVDLAGVQKSEIDLTVEPRRIVVRGAREAPEPAHGDIPDEAKERIKFIPVENVDEVLAHALQKGGAAKPSS